MLSFLKTLAVELLRSPLILVATAAWSVTAVNPTFGVEPFIGVWSPYAIASVATFTVAALSFLRFVHDLLRGEVLKKLIKTAFGPVLGYMMILAGTGVLVVASSTIYIETVLFRPDAEEAGGLAIFMSLIMIVGIALDTVITHSKRIRSVD